MIKEFQFSFADLEITANNISEMMGFENGVVPEPFPELINYALDLTLPESNIRGGYKIFGSNDSGIDKNTIIIGEQVFNPSKVVIKQFKNASSFALFICTAGPEISNRSKEIPDPMLAYVFDIVGSVTVEKATNKMQNSLEREYKELGLGISDRFSPGYCEWSVSEQQILFALMPKNFCGVTLSESSLMWPIKSVSGIIGIGNKLKRLGYQCNWCNDKNCLTGKIKRQKKLKKTNKTVG